MSNVALAGLHSKRKFTLSFHAGSLCQTHQFLQSKVSITPFFIQRVRRRELTVECLTVQVDVDPCGIHLGRGVDCEGLTGGGPFNELFPPDS